ncbi:hypothetical protein [Methyloferula stellata]|uniref:hypothetical protein n=1 Tax=Methyloferula stellata TaxID=876270 RepID=UPI001268B7B8|nr:hypothetical protein [Methyloferula stellata]
MHFHPLYVLLAAGMVCGPAAWADGSTPQMQAPRPDKENPAAVASLDRLAITRERPLFRPDRRPLAAPPKVADAPPPPPAPPAAPPQVSLSGVVVDEKGPRALLRSDPSGKIAPARLGDDIGGWRITEIEDQYMVMSLDNRTVRVSLFAGDHGGRQVAIVHQSDRVFEVNAAGVLRSHRVRRAAHR